MPKQSVSKITKPSQEHYQFWKFNYKMYDSDNYIVCFTWIWYTESTESRKMALIEIAVWHLVCDVQLRVTILGLWRVIVRHRSN